MEVIGKLLRLVVTRAADASGMIRRAAELPATLVIRLGRCHHRPVEVADAHAQGPRRVVRHDDRAVLRVAEIVVVFSEYLLALEVPPTGPKRPAGATSAAVEQTV
eukprot:7382831-Prymnesium_polylepis.1